MMLLPTYLIVILLTTVHSDAELVDDEFCHQFKRANRTILLLAETSLDGTLLLLDSTFTGFRVPIDRLKHLFAQAPSLPSLDLRDATIFHLRTADEAKIGPITSGRGVFFYRSPPFNIRYPWNDPFVVVVAADRSAVTMLPLDLRAGTIHRHQTGALAPETNIFFSRREFSVYMLNESLYLCNINLQLSKLQPQEFEFARSQFSKTLSMRRILPNSYTDGGLVIADTVALGYSNRLALVTIYKAGGEEEVQSLPFSEFFICNPLPDPTPESGSTGSAKSPSSQSGGVQQVDAQALLLYATVAFIATLILGLVIWSVGCRKRHSHKRSSSWTEVSTSGRGQRWWTRPSRSWLKSKSKLTLKGGFKTTGKSTSGKSPAQ